mmetsp:Transcript_15447/g.22714  ORF Transcript_15447/g.22714 Transcript_15447/m.22714 type:complete len:232 (-) Transcript_15447:195-890(-)
MPLPCLRGGALPDFLLGHRQVTPHRLHVRPAHLASVAVVRGGCCHRTGGLLGNGHAGTKLVKKLAVPSLGLVGDEDQHVAGAQGGVHHAGRQHVHRQVHHIVHRPLAEQVLVGVRPEPLRGEEGHVAARAHCQVGPRTVQGGHPSIWHRLVHLAERSIPQVHTHESLAVASHNHLAHTPAPLYHQAGDDCIHCGVEDVPRQRDQPLSRAVQRDGRVRVQCSLGGAVVVEGG